MNENKTNINWYPGHMAKTKRLVKEQLDLIDIVYEVVDSRMPYSSKIRDLDDVVKNKPRILILNKCDMADDAATKKWIEFYKSQGIFAIPIDCKNGKGINAFKDTVKTVLADKLQSYREKGMVGKPLRVMVVGIPNVGKSTFINSYAKKACTKVGNKPGVTKGKQWIRINNRY